MKIMRPRAPRTTPQVTVVIPCYNYARYLPAVVDSVLGQTGVDARVIIVDDASSDDSAETARELASREPRISVVAHEQNMGHIATYNDGLSRVSTEFVALLSADDLLAPGALFRATALMTANPRVGMVYGRPLEFSDENDLPRTNGRMRHSWTVWPGHEWIGWACRRGRCFILSPEVVMRTEVMRQVGSYNPSLPHSGDLEYWLRTAAHWDVGRINGPVQAYYRVHGSNMHLTTFATMMVDLGHRLEAFRVLRSPEVLRGLPRGNRLFERAQQAVGREALILAARTLDSGGPTADAAALRDFASRSTPGRQGRRRMQGVGWRLARADGGKAPMVWQRAAEAGRTQLDRVRWRAWRMVGIS
ncbi:MULTISPECIES: glycosyltransferase [Arthrobacter]|uniref:Glycosyltransferase n=1 Tax=Arthrobacter terricola TaxID=2547396 RepID=A0A4R5KXZ0_9MICC|nr:MULTISPECIES: glycosyltransferase [Arthrobacter]MBT8160327.1 glycosyltransferase [Arthrobacter sp. GN70]TDF99977.1 glycosyltransferase [Arthrobacter terricola]